MKIKRLTLTLPARFRYSAHGDARRIAQEIAEQLANADAGVSQEKLVITVDGQQTQGAALATVIGQQVCVATKGNS